MGNNLRSRSLTKSWHGLRCFCSTQREEKKTSLLLLFDAEDTPKVAVLFCVFLRLCFSFSSCDNYSALMQVLPWVQQAEPLQFMLCYLATKLISNQNLKLLQEVISPNKNCIWKRAESCMDCELAPARYVTSSRNPDPMIFWGIPSSSQQQMHSVTLGEAWSLCRPITGFWKPGASHKLWHLEIKTNLREKHGGY